MSVTDWKYYNHAAVPDVAPHATPDLTPLRDGSIWNMEGRPLLTRWTEHFDCAQETNWWYCIKDTPYEPEKLKSTRRSHITKGRKNFLVSICDPRTYLGEIYQVAASAFAAYPARYRPRLDKDAFTAGIEKVAATGNYLFFAARDRASGVLCGYAYLRVHEDYADFEVIKAVPAEEKRGVNAALLDGICRHFSARLGSKFYIAGGERNVLHETRFQDYLATYFGFRKAYATLRVGYRKDVGVFVRLLYPFRALLKKCPGHWPALAGAVLRMEELARRGGTPDADRVS